MILPQMMAEEYNLYIVQYNMLMNRFISFGGFVTKKYIFLGSAHSVCSQ